MTYSQLPVLTFALLVCTVVAQSSSPSSTPSPSTSSPTDRAPLILSGPNSIPLFPTPPLDFLPDASPRPRGRAAQVLPPILLNPVKAPIIDGRKRVVTRFFSQIPSFQGVASKIVGLTALGKQLYVTTSTSGGLVYRINARGIARLYFNVTDGIQRSTGRALSVTNAVHGGVRSIAFHPSYFRTGLFYTAVMEERPVDESNVRYLSKPPAGQMRANADSVVIEWKFNFSRRAVDLMSYRQVLRIGMPVLDHPIKQMVFAGNKLFIGHGDGSFQSATTGGGQANDGLGKVIRILPRKFGNLPYKIPNENPFRNNPRFLDELFAVGFRNPHNLCFSKKHGLFVTDAGRDNVEEINIVKAGRNYGWSDREGQFVHLEVGGTITGVAKLPPNDLKFNYTYPNAVVGHRSVEGDRFNGQAVAGSCPIENGSELKGIFLYANFPNTGEVYYSFTAAMKRAVVTGKVGNLRRASTYRARIFFDDDRDEKTPLRELENLRDVVRIELGVPNLNRVDLRFGRGSKGEIYWSSKASGRVYLITSSVPSEANQR